MKHMKSKRTFLIALKGPTISAEDIAQYGKIIVALRETIRLMAEIDEVIDAHGGFPLVGSGKT